MSQTIPSEEMDCFIDEGEQTRILHRMRRLILTGRVRVPRTAAARLIGPDTAYHLYRHEKGAPPTDGNPS